MKIKDYVIIGILITIIALVIKMMKTSRNQSEVINAMAVKSGVLKESEIKPKKINSAADEYEEEDEDSEEPKSNKKIKLKKTQRQTVSLFEDGIPKQIGEARDLYMGKFSDIDKTKFYNTLYNLRPSNTLNFEKIDGKNYWGLGDWFDEEGSLYEEYAEKIPGSANLTVTTN